MPDFRRGTEEIKSSVEAAKNRGGSSRPFVPSIYWKDSDEYRSRYLLILNKIEDIPKVDVISFIPVPDSKVGESVIARTDPAIGDSYDPLVEEWDGNAQESNVLVAVELEPIVDSSGPRAKPSGFEVKTSHFTRRVRDDEGKATDETEEVVAPAVGVIVQRPTNFGNILAAFDESEAPIHETPVKITRNETQPVTFQIQGYENLEVDLSNLVEHIDGISYLGDEMDELREAVGDLDPAEAANLVGNIILDKRLEELADGERYEAIYKTVNKSLDTFGNKKKSKPKSSARPRPSQRRSAPEPPEEKSPEEEPSATAKLNALREKAMKSRAKQAA